jgi:hypothetical protein
MLTEGVMTMHGTGGRAALKRVRILANARRTARYDDLPHSTNGYTTASA